MLLKFFTLHGYCFIDIKSSEKNSFPGFLLPSKWRKMFHPLNRDSELFLIPILPFFSSSKTPDFKQGTYCFGITTTFTSLPSRQAGHVTKLWPIEREHRCHRRSFWVMTSKTSKRSTHSGATAAKSLQSCPTLCDPKDGSPPGSPGPGILQARILAFLQGIFPTQGWRRAWRTPDHGVTKSWTLILHCLTIQGSHFLCSDLLNL